MSDGHTTEWKMGTLWGPQIFQKSRSHLHILGDRKATCSNFHTKVQKFAVTFEPHCYLALSALCMWMIRHFLLCACEWYGTFCSVHVNDTALSALCMWIIRHFLLCACEWYGTFCSVHVNDTALSALCMWMIRHFLLCACEWYTFVCRGRGGCNNFAENIGHRHTKFNHLHPWSTKGEEKIWWNLVFLRRKSK